MATSTGDAHRVGTLGAPPLHGGARDFFAEQLYEAISHAFVALDRDWRVVQVNSRAGAILGREPASLIGRHVWSEFPEAVGRPFYYACERAVATSTPLLTEGCFAPWECRCSSRLYPSASGLLILFAEGNATDVRRTHGVQQSRYLRAILDTAPECIKVVRRDGALLDMNRAGLSLIEAPSLDAVAGQCVYPMVVERDRGEFRRAIEAACDGVPALLEFELVTLGGKRRVMDSRIAPLRDQNGIVIAALCMTRDVTERRANEELLRESEARFRRLVERAPLGSYLNDADGNTIYCNPRLEAIFGRSAGDIVNGMWRDTVHPDDRDRLFAGCEAFFRGNDDEMRYEYRIVRGDGDIRDVVVEQVRLRTPDGRTEGYIGVIDDVTEHRALEAHLRHSQKLEAVGRLAGGVAHDFNNLLTVIGNYGEFLKQELAPGSAGRADLEELLGATRRAAVLTRQLLTFGRRQVSVPKLLDPNMVIRGVEEMLRRLIGEHIAFVTDLDPDVGRVLIDPGQLEQVIVNLAVNSRDAMPSGGLLTVETERTQLTAGDLLHLSADGGVATLVGNTGDHVVVRVTDTGLGMDDATQRRVFEPFFTTKPHGKGTGLGLPTIYGIVAQAGGSLRLRSAPGRGTTIEVYLPRYDALEAASQATVPDTPARVVTTGRETVLVAEDETAVRESVRRILERAGYTVIEARHGADALLLWREHREQIALVLTDVVMPEMRGTELASSVRAQAPDTKILYMSGYASEAATSAELPGAMLIEKPFDAETLLRAVRASLDAVRPSAS